MTTLVIILAVVFLALLIYLSTLDGEYHVDRSLTLNAPVNDVFRAVVDFKTWPNWSPWLLHEPDTRLDYSDNYAEEGGFYTWDGKIVGAGKLTHLHLNVNQSIDQRIEFTRPFKSVNSVSWRFNENEDGTEVHWTMQGKMPFFFRFMTKMTVMMISKDYDLGLHLLNGYLNPQNPHPRYRFVGIEQVPELTYAYRSFKGDMQAMITVMETGFPELIESTDKLQIKSGFPLTIYHKVDPVKKYFEGDIAVPIKKPPADTSLQISQLMGGKYYKVECLGDYKFLELSWYKAYSHIRMLKLKIDSKRPSLEVYENNPNDLQDTSELKTSLYLPVK